MPDPGPSRVPEFVPLCEQCGYVIESLPEDSACPECGRPIASSLAEARPGSPWQAGRGPAAVRWAFTAWAIARRPRQVFSSIKFDRSRNAGLLWPSLFGASGFTIASALTPIVLRDIAATSSKTLLTPETALLLGLTVLIPVTILLALVTLLTDFFLRSFASLQGFRAHSSINETVICHASTGWLLGAFAGCMAVTSSSAVLHWPGGLAWTHQNLKLAGDLVVVGGLPIAGLTAWAWFSLLACLGVRVNRFASGKVRKREGHVLRPE
ncbi:MAG: hypothetical protein JJU33_04385 [Phycisphaerales bacterium]|nr:hypothetical protein [Phycisphaerales bacterium]